MFGEYMFVFGSFKIGISYKNKNKKKKRQTEITNQVISNLALIRRSRLLIQPTFFRFLFLPLSSK